MPPSRQSYEWTPYWRGFRAGAVFVLVIVALTIVVAWMLAYA